MPFDPKELRRMIESEPDDECARCSATVTTLAGFEPSPLCHACADAFATEVMPELLDALEAKTKTIEMLRASLKRCVTSMTIMRMGANKNDKRGLDDAIADASQALGVKVGG